jgi:galactose oxidase
MTKSSLLRSLTRGLVAVTVASGGMLAAATPASAVVTWERISAYHSGHVVTVPSPWTTNGLQVVQGTWGAMAYNTQWTLTSVGLNTYTVKNRYSNQCLDTENGISTTPGTPVVQRPCDDTLSQNWVRTHDDVLSVWRFSNSYSGLYLGVENGSSVLGAGFVQKNLGANNASMMFQMW